MMFGVIFWRFLLPILVFESAWKKRFVLAAEDKVNDHGCNKFGVCLPGGEDIAVSPRTVTASSTCGSPTAGQYCQLIPFPPSPRIHCSACDSNSTRNRHPADFMIDRSPGYSGSNFSTFWQSQTWWEWFQTEKNAPLMANVTLAFNKSYIVTGDIRVTFASPKPSQMVIEKSVDFGRTWLPLQYFADNCREKFNMTASSLNCSTHAVLCTEKYSDLNAGVVYFSFLNCYTKETFWDKTTQALTMATDIRLRLEFPATDGRHIFQDEFHMNRYFYAISDIQVFGRCQCNGHAPNCEFPTLNGKAGVYVNIPTCMCKHHTEGTACERCEPLYNNKTWMPATSSTQGNPCKKCECYEHASSCVFNSSLEHGVCDDCRDNTTGYFCEQCKDKFYRNLTRSLNDSDVCLDCDCALEGVTNNGSCSQEVATIGQCMCRNNVTGRRCDRCNDTYYGYTLTSVGSCVACQCRMFGMINDSLNCNQTSGQCMCKTNIELRTCSQCKLGFYNFPNSTETDCLECNCDYGGSTEEICERAKGRCLCRNGIQGTTCSNVTENRFFPQFDYFLFEAEDQSGNYTFTTDVSKYDKYFTGRGYAKITVEQLYIDFDISVAIDGNYSLVLRYSKALGNVGIRLRGGDSAVTGCPALDRNVSVSGLQPRGQGVSWKSDETFTLCSGNNYTIRVYPDASATKNVSIKIDSLVLIPQLNGLRAYIRNTGPDIDACLANFSTIQGGNAVSSGCRGVTFSTMVELFNGSLACECSKIGAESATCDAYGGQCRCKRGVMGRTCDRCQPNYYNFTQNGCSPCDCDVFGSHNLSGCDPISGKCICKQAVEGRTCGQCEVNFFGLNTGKGCEPCNCNTTGSLNKTCDGVTGKCYCKPGVEDETTDKCQRCQPNYFNFTETGCLACNCNKAGSRLLQCHQSSGECPCKINTSGKKCGNCVNATYALEESNPNGCTPCFCFNRTRQCSSAEGFVLTSIVQSLNLTITPDYYIRLSPQRFAGNQLYSYGRLFEVHISGAVNVSNEVHLHLNGSIRNALFRLTSTQCGSIENGRLCVLLHENNAVGVQKLTAYEMQSLLVDVKEMGLNLTRLGNQLNNATVLEVSMGSARRGAGGRNDKAQHVEKCACPKNYKKLSCDECSSGFTRDIANSNAFVSCSLCSCNNRSKTCDPESRVCSNCHLSVGDFCEDCEYGVDITTGCTECLREFWSRNIILYGCQACNCVLNNTVNHNSSVCNATSGQCSCKTYVGGQQCQRCDDNYYNTTHGCRECPTCYGLIQNHVEDLKTVIERVQQMVDRLIIRFKSIGHKEFAQRLSNVRANVSKMFERATDANSTANDGTENLNDTQNGFGNLSSSIDNLLTKMDQLERQRNELEGIMNRTINWTETAYRLLNYANLSGPRIETLAKTIASFLQPIEFDKIELRRLNKTQWDISQNLTSNSDVQSRKIDRVLVDARESKSDLEKVAASIRGLQNKSSVASTDAEDIKESSVRYSESAENVKDIIDEVLNTVKELGVLIEVNKNLTRAFRVENRSMGYLDLEKNVSISVNNAYTQIHRSNATLNSSYALLDDARSAHREAILANESAKATLDDAIRTRYVLREFQNRSQHAERVANDSLQQISTTNEVSRKSIENIRNVSESITDALNSTDDALKLAKKAYSLSSEENQNITSIYNTSKFLQGKQNPATCSRDMMSGYKRNITDRNQTLTPVVTSCPSREANTAAIVAADAVSRSEKTMNNATGNHGNVFDFSHVVSKAKDAVEAIEAVVNSQIQQNKIDTHDDAFTRLREETKKLREAKEEKAMFIQQLRAKVNTMKSELKGLESLRDSLRDLPPCGGA